MSDFNIERASEKARRLLTEAQSICHESNNQLSSVKARIREWQKYRSKLHFVLDCVTEQCQFLVDVLLKHATGGNLIQKQWRQMVLEDLVGDMERWQQEIQKKVAKLDGVSNALDRERDSKLGDFISRGSFHALDEKINEIPVIRKQVEKISRQYQQMVGKVQSQLLETRLRKVKQLYEAKFGDNCDSNIKLDEHVTVEADQLEQELTEFLKSLTDHFDKCDILLSKKLAPEDIKTLYEIVERDDKELPAIGNALKEAADDVAHFVEHANNLLDGKEAEKALVQSMVLKLLNELRKHEEYILVFEGIANLIRKFVLSCRDSIQQTKELLDFYSNFEKSYYSLLSEVNRRRETAEKMSHLLESCREQLEQLSSTDIRERQKFLRENGDFLPETIWPDEIGNISPLYSFDFHVRKV
ncbi:LADA_0H14004g1_1 [Lachancea dasiensis]|uniref:Autophagy-related protein 17 n=1 Tax=Lachancea dasiensis TaxID=1072105 RepID=A0A1G4K4E8_9SACH|nr:LADA_0H14004g1_1 [Lachancea dasiensis]